MKLLIISLWSISLDSIGGTERFILDLANGMKKRGIDVDVLMLSGNHININGVNYIPINILLPELNEYSIKKKFFPNCTEETIKKFCYYVENNFDASEYDIIHINSLLFCRVYETKKRLFTIHEAPIEFNRNWGYRSFFNISKIIRKNRQHDSLFVTPTLYYKKIFQKHFHFKINTIPHSINTIRLKSERTRKDILEKYFLDNKYTILFPSRLEMIQKQPDLAIKAINKIKNSLPDFQLLFTGLSHQYLFNIKILKNMTKKMGLRAFFLKVSSREMADIYSLADLVILPSKYESFGYAALEALSLRTKTVLTKIPSFIEIANGNQYAYLCNGTIKGLSEQIFKSIYDKKNLSVAPEWLKRYSQQSFIREYQKLYKKILIG